jgi:hypothetical protein
VDRDKELAFLTCSPLILLVVMVVVVDVVVVVNSFDFI